MVLTFSNLKKKKFPKNLFLQKVRTIKMYLSFFYLSSKNFNSISHFVEAGRFKKIDNVGIQSNIF